jgi:hypothetical protein
MTMALPGVGLHADRFEDQRGVKPHRHESLLVHGDDCARGCCDGGRSPSHHHFSARSKPGEGVSSHIRREAIEAVEQVDELAIVHHALGLVAALAADDEVVDLVSSTPADGLEMVRREVLGGEAFPAVGEFARPCRFSPRRDRRLTPRNFAALPQI